MRAEQRGGRNSGERRLADEELVGNAAERIEIRAAVDVRIGGDLLGRHVLRRSDREAHRRQRFRLTGCAGRIQRLADPEVGDGRAVAGEEDVLRLDVAVNHTALVREVERSRDIAQDPGGFAQWHRAGPEEPHAQGLTFDERHRVERQPIRFAGREDGHDVRMLQPGGQQDLAPEPLQADARSQLGCKHLHDHTSAERTLFGDEHAAHAAPAELAFERDRRR